MKRTPLRRKTPLSARSKKRLGAQRAYVRLVRDLLDEYPGCEVGPIIATGDPGWVHCTRWASGLHHLRKRSQGGTLVDRLGVLRACSPCNGWVEDNPRLAHRLGLVIRSHVDTRDS